jgi:membrane-associated phospholipid phosphatase
MLIATAVLVLELASGDPANLGQPGTGTSRRTCELADGQSPAAVVDPQDVSPGPTQDQQPEEDKKPPTPAHTGIHALFYGLLEDVKHLPSMPNLYIAAIGGGLAIAVHPVDTTLNERLLSHDTLATNVWKPGHIVGNDFVQTGLALATFAYGRVTDKPKASHFGMDLLRAQIIAGALTEGLKYAVGRERPNHMGDPSFPSGHAALTFATATVIERHLGWKMAGLGYAVAAYVATSRLHDNVHYASDVVFGAAIGTISGRTVTQHGRNAWTLVPIRTPGGVAVMVTRTARSDEAR